MSEKLKYNAEYELRASPKMLFPYISTASGLSQWFCQKVNTLPDQKFDFMWDNESHVARQVSLRLNKSVKFEFIDNTEEGHNSSYFELKIEVSDLTGSTFLKITDYSTNTDPDDLKDLWGYMIESLKETIGG
jgi:uncharacterized protein YndB with AHSA1/START domain